nr:MAG TPA: hypothetical protein [Caudoviricetes sp.]
MYRGLTRRGPAADAHAGDAQAWLPLHECAGNGGIGAQAGVGVVWLVNQAGQQAAIGAALQSHAQRGGENVCHGLFDVVQACDAASCEAVHQLGTPAPLFAWVWLLPTFLPLWVRLPPWIAMPPWMALSPPSPAWPATPPLKVSSFCTVTAPVNSVSGLSTLKLGVVSVVLSGVMCSCEPPTFNVMALAMLSTSVPVVRSYSQNSVPLKSWRSACRLVEACGMSLLNRPSRATAWFRSPSGASTRQGSLATGGRQWRVCCTPPAARLIHWMWVVTRSSLRRTVQVAGVESPPGRTSSTRPKRIMLAIRRYSSMGLSSGGSADMPPWWLAMCTRASARTCSGGCYINASGIAQVVQHSIQQLIDLRVTHPQQWSSWVLVRGTVCSDLVTQAIVVHTGNGSRAAHKGHHGLIALTNGLEVAHGTQLAEHGPLAELACTVTAAVLARLPGLAVWPLLGCHVGLVAPAQALGQLAREHALLCGGELGQQRGQPGFKALQVAHAQLRSMRLSLTCVRVTAPSASGRGRASTRSVRSRWMIRSMLAAFRYSASKRMPLRSGLASRSFWCCCSHCSSG